MKTVLTLLKKELKAWKLHEASEKRYFKHYENSNYAIRSFARNKKHISELETAIEILSK